MSTKPPPYETYEQKSDRWVKSSDYYLDDGNLFIVVRPNRIVIDGNCVHQRTGQEHSVQCVGYQFPSTLETLPTHITSC